MKLPPYISMNNDSLSIDVVIQPRASKDEIVGIHNGRLKIRLTAPPVKGAANKQCVAFLAKQLEVSRKCIKIVSGFTSRTKRVCIQTKDPAALLTKLPHK